MSQKILLSARPEDVLPGRRIAWLWHTNEPVKCAFCGTEFQNNEWVWHQKELRKSACEGCKELLFRRVESAVSHLDEMHTYPMKIIIPEKLAE